MSAQAALNDARSDLAVLRRRLDDAAHVGAETARAMSSVRTSTLKLFEERDAKVDGVMALVRDVRSGYAAMDASVAAAQGALEAKAGQLTRGMVRCCSHARAGW